MASVCFYFQVHQPFRLRRYSVFDTDRHYFDEYKNAELCRKVAQKCYLPANRMLLDTIRMHEGRFRIAYSISGVAIEQFQQFVARVIHQVGRRCRFLFHAAGREGFAHQTDQGVVGQLPEALAAASAAGDVGGDFLHFARAERAQAVHESALGGLRLRCRSRSLFLRTLSIFRPCHAPHIPELPG